MESPDMARWREDPTSEVEQSDHGQDRPLRGTGPWQQTLVRSSLANVNIPSLETKVKSGQIDSMEALSKRVDDYHGIDSQESKVARGIRLIWFDR